MPIYFYLSTCLMYRTYFHLFSYHNNLHPIPPPHHPRTNKYLRICLFIFIRLSFYPSSSAFNPTSISLISTFYHLDPFPQVTDSRHLQKGFMRRAIRRQGIWLLCGISWEKLETLSGSNTFYLVFSSAIRRVAGLTRCWNWLSSAYWALEGWLDENG